MLYGWFPSVNGDLKYNLPGSGSDFSVDANRVVDSLQFAFMGSFVR